MRTILRQIAFNFMIIYSRNLLIIRNCVKWQQKLSDVFRRYVICNGSRGLNEGEHIFKRLYLLCNVLAKILAAADYKLSRWNMAKTVLTRATHSDY